MLRDTLSSPDKLAHITPNLSRYMHHPFRDRRQADNEGAAAHNAVRHIVAKLSAVFHTVERRVVRKRGKAVVPVTSRTSAPHADAGTATELELGPIFETPPKSLRPAEAATVATAPTSLALCEGRDLDECEVLLRRAIELVRAPPRLSQISTGEETRTATPVESVRSMRAERPPAVRAIVRIRHDPRKAIYFAEDTKSGLSVLGHQDSARLRAMCDRLGWHVLS